jgi:hypothetical protein
MTLDQILFTNIKPSKNVICCSNLVTDNGEIRTIKKEEKSIDNICVVHYNYLNLDENTIKTKDDILPTQYNDLNIKPGEYKVLQKWGNPEFEYGGEIYPQKNNGNISYMILISDFNGNNYYMHSIPKLKNYNMENSKNSIILDNESMCKLYKTIELGDLIDCRNQEYEKNIKIQDKKSPLNYLKQVWNQIF